MSAMGARLGAVLEDDASRFSGAEFADARLGAVLGSVKRRRAARAAGVSSVSLFGAGALAIGAGQVPWGSFVLGASPAGPSDVNCATTTPGLVTARLSAPDGTAWVVQDKSTGDLAFLGAEGTSPQAWDADGSMREISVVGGDAEFNLKSGAKVVFTVTGLHGAVEPSDEYTVTTVTRYFEQVRPEVSIVANEGNATSHTGLATWTVYGKKGQKFATIQADRTVAAVVPPAGESVQYTLRPDGYVVVYIPGVGLAQLILDGDLLTWVGAETSSGMVGSATWPTTLPAPTVTCVTTSPEPSVSASTAPSRSAKPTPLPAVDPVSGDTPFQCGYAIASDEYGTDALRVFGSPDY